MWRTGRRLGRPGGLAVARPAELLALNRGHWEIENRLHHVRDVTYDEDRLHIRAGRLANNLAGLANAAVSIVRLKGRFAHLPQANGHYAARQGEALREVVRPGCPLPPSRRNGRPPAAARARKNAGQPSPRGNPADNAPSANP